MSSPTKLTSLFWFFPNFSESYGAVFYISIISLAGPLSRALKLIDSDVLLDPRRMRHRLPRRISVSGELRAPLRGAASLLQVAVDRPQNITARWHNSALQSSLLAYRTAHTIGDLRTAPHLSLGALLLQQRLGLRRLQGAAAGAFAREAASCGLQAGPRGLP